jgi:long-chain acyl-CoA synthetase
MPVEVLRGFDEAFGTKVLEGYGLSETTGMGSFNLPSQERKPGSIGVPIGGTEFRLVDDDGNDVPAGEPGEIAMRGPFVMRGYWSARTPRPRRSATAGSTPATWRPSTTTATSSSSTARRS